MTWAPLSILRDGIGSLPVCSRFWASPFSARHPIFRDKYSGSGPRERQCDIAPSRREHLADPASNELALFRARFGVEADIVGDRGRAFQHHDAVADLKRFRDRMGDEDGGLAVFLH